FQQRSELQPKHHQPFVRGLWIAVIFCVLLSFTFPFNLGLESLLYKLGAIQQFRGMGRFAWVAFYPLLLALILLWFGSRSVWTKRTHVWMWVVIALIGMDGVQRINNVSERLVHKRDGLFQEQSVNLPTSACSVIFPLPCFQIGSENVGSDASGSLKAACYDLSIKSGLPMIAASMSRTSLAQTFQNIALTQPLFEFPDVINTWKQHDNRPWLLLVDPQRSYRAHEKLLIEKSDSIGIWQGYTCRKLPLEAWTEIHQITNEWSIGAQTSGYLDGNFADTTSSITLSQWQRDVRFNHTWTRLDEIQFPSDWMGDSVVVQFEVADFHRDLLPRSFVETVQMNGEMLVRYESEMMGKRFVFRRDGYAIIQYPTRIRAGAATMRLSVENKLIQGQTMHLRNLTLFKVNEVKSSSR
ncbi:MAG: hypothetical protein ACKOZY_09000, partial [Flavobacteriales bacterium]